MLYFAAVYEVAKAAISHCVSGGYCSLPVGSVSKSCSGFVFKQNAMHCISPYAIVVCVSVCLSVCVYAAFVDARKTV